MQIRMGVVDLDFSNPGATYGGVVEGPLGNGLKGLVVARKSGARSQCLKCFAAIRLVFSGVTKRIREKEQEEQGSKDRSRHRRARFVSEWIEGTCRGLSTDDRRRAVSRASTVEPSVYTPNSKS